MTKKDLRFQLKQSAGVAQEPRPLPASEDFSELWNRSSYLGAFSPLNDEPDISLWVLKALQENKPVYFPRIEDRDLVFYRFEGQTDFWESGPWGLREPKLQAIRWEPQEQKGFGLWLIPGLAFDLQGRRLGRGRGYYDRWLKKLGDWDLPVLRVGAVPDGRLLEEIPTDPWDQKVHRLWLKDRWIVCAP